MPELRLSVDPAMGCRHCIREVTRWLRDVPGVETIAVDARAAVVLSGTMAVADVLAVFAGTPYSPRVLAGPSSASA